MLRQNSPYHEVDVHVHSAVSPHRNVRENACQSLFIHVFFSGWWPSWRGCKVSHHLAQKGMRMQRTSFKHHGWMATFGIINWYSSWALSLSELWSKPIHKPTPELSRLVDFFYKQNPVSLVAINLLAMSYIILNINKETYINILWVIIAYSVKIK